MKKLIALTIIAFITASCTMKSHIGNGGYSDLSLNVSDENFDVVRLETITEKGESFWGIPKNNSKSDGMIVRFNGVVINKTPKVLPILSLIGLTSSIGTSIFISGQQVVNNRVENRIPLGVAYLIGLPIAGTINNFLYPTSAAGMASSKFNLRLAYEYKDIDVFLNPKYEFRNEIGLWSQSSILTGNIMGATLKNTTPFKKSKSLINNMSLSKQANISTNNNKTEFLEKKPKSDLNENRNLNTKPLEISNSNKIKYKNQVLQEGAQLLVDFKGTVYRGVLLSQNRTSVTLFNIEKNLSGKWVKMWDDKSKTYMFQKSFIRGYLYN